MSYSFNVLANSKAEARQKAVVEFDKVATAQPEHKADRDQALAALDAFLDIVSPAADDNTISVSMSGSLGWQHDRPGLYIGAGLNISVRSYQEAPKPAAE